jgi:hypothetical protein
MFEVTGTVEAIVENKERVWEGKTIPASYQVQILERGETRDGGPRVQVINLVVDDPALYRGLEGRVVKVPVGIAAGQKGLSYWPHKNARPQVVPAGEG